MIKSTLGAPLGGTTLGGHYGFESLTLSLMTPPNFGGGGGSCFPSIVVVALGEPGVPVVCICAVGEDSALLSWANVSVMRLEAASQPISPPIASIAIICTLILSDM